MPKYALTEENCDSLICTIGTHKRDCSCISNNWQCEQYSSLQYSCINCKSDYKMVTDISTGDYCKDRTEWKVFLAIGLVGGFILLFLFFCLRKMFLGWHCCQNPNACCHKCWFNTCLKCENCLKCLLCFNKKNGGPCICCRWCFSKEYALDPLLEYSNQSTVKLTALNNRPLRRELQLNQSMPDNQNSVKNENLNNNPKNQNLPP